MTLDDSSSVPMTPREYVEGIVLPTLREFLAARDDQRRAYLACLVVWHVADSIGLAEAARKPGFEGLRGRPRRGALDTATTAVQVEAERRCGDAAKIVRDIANGTKHPGRLPLLPGSERRVPAFSFGVSGAGFGEGRWSVPGLAIDKGGEALFLDVCAQLVLAAFVRAYPAHLGEISLRSFIDPGLEVLGLTVESAWLTGIIGWAASKPEAEELWVSKTAANGLPEGGTELVIEVMLTASNLQTLGGLTRGWETGGFADLYKQWRSELAVIIGQEVRLGLLGWDGPPSDQEPIPAPTPAGPRVIRLWTRPDPDDEDPACLSPR